MRSLSGRPSPAVTNHRLRNPEARTALYRLWDGAGLCYVGITQHLRERLYAHHLTKPWWPEVEHVTVRRYESLWAAATAEDAVIKTCKPLHNRRQCSDYAGLPPLFRDIVGAYAELHHIARNQASYLLITDPAARQEARAEVRRRQEATIERFAAIRRDAPGDDGEPYSIEHANWFPAAEAE